MFKLRFNKYEIIFIGIIFCQIFGVIGGFAQPIRIISLIIFFYLIDKIPKRIIRDYKWFFIFFAIIILYSFVYLILSINRDYLEDILKGALYNLINFITCFNLLILSYKVRDLYKVIYTGWILFYLIALPLSIYEIIFNHHFVSVIEDGTILGGSDKLKIYSSLTFGNYNYYNMILMISLPFLFNQLNEKVSIYNIIFLFLICFIFLINGSRSTLIAIVISLLSLLIFRRDFKAFIFLLICILTFYLNIDRFEYTINRINELGLEDSSRSKMFNITYQILSDTNLLGIGPNYFKYYVSQNNLSEILAPHNFMLEILSEYGIIIFILLLFYLFKIFKINKKNKFILLLSFILFFLIITINSLYVQGVNIWIFLTLINLLSNYDKTTNKTIS